MNNFIHTVSIHRRNFQRAVRPVLDEEFTDVPYDSNNATTSSNVTANTDLEVVKQPARSRLRHLLSGKIFEKTKHITFSHFSIFR